jgi:hypothetical protein
LPKPIRAAERWLVLGTAGVGKSYWTKRFVDRLGPQLVIIWDPESEWAGPLADNGIRGAQCFRGIGELAAWVAKHNPRLEGRRLVIQGGGAAQFEELCRIAYRACDLWLVIDEAHSWASAKDAPQALLDLVQRCRHVRVSLVFIAQRPKGLTPVIRNVKSNVVLFQLPDSASRDWVRNEVAEDLAEPLRTLPPRVCLKWSGGTTWEQSSPKQRPSPSSRPTAPTRSTRGSARTVGSPTPPPTSTRASSTRSRSRS